MKKYPKVSIIIPFYDFQNWPRFLRNFNSYLKLNYPNFEILLVSDRNIKTSLPKTKIVYTNRRRTGPAEKRDLALKKAKGAICAFIDDDAYPHPDWLKNALINFQNEKIGAVGGPGVTPPQSRLGEQITGLIYNSFWGFGFGRFRFMPQRKRFIFDYPAYNLLIRKNILQKVGGFDSQFYGGEDTKVCLSIVKEGKKIIYDPKVLVYHHRRPLFLPYLRQIANVGLHRGFFVKAYPETSRHPIYFLPSLFTLSIISGLILAFFWPKIIFLPAGLVLLLFWLGFFSTLKEAGALKAPLVALGIILTHLTYGTYFLKGLLLEKLER